MSTERLIRAILLGLNLAILAISAIELALIGPNEWALTLVFTLPGWMLFILPQR